MKKQHKIFSVLLVTLLVGGCVTQSQKNPPSISDVISQLGGLSIDDFFEESYTELLLRSPETVTYLGIAEDLGMRNDELDDLSDEFIQETHELQREILRLLRAYDREELTSEQQLTYDIYEWYLDDLVRGQEFVYYDYPISHFLGSYHDELGRLFTEYHQIENTQDAEDYISRLSKVDTQVDQLMEGLKLREEKGIIPPRFIIDMALRQLNEFIQISGPDSFRIEEISLYRIFAEKVNALDELSDKEKQGFLDEAYKEIEEGVIPAFLKLIDYVKYLSTIGTNDAGVWKFPRGDEYYNYLLRHETTTNMTPEEIHQLGLSEVERIRKEMLSVFSDLGYSEQEKFNYLLDSAITAGGFYDVSTPEGKDAYVEAYEGILEKIEQNLDKMFDIHTEANLAIVTEDHPGPAFYTPASIDGSRPGAFHIGIGGFWAPRYNMKTVAYHEAIPGHHFQIALAQELDVPFLRNDIIFNGYAEGWALYSERLGWELGMYEDDPYGNIGRLQYELLRAVRLVTDTGIHAKGWTREEAIAYMNEALGDSSGGMSSEVYRYIVIPGQAACYKIGMLKILELRQRAMDELGDEFDIKEFHRVLLLNGSMPLEILERVIQEYIESKLSYEIHHAMILESQNAVI